MKFKLSVLFAVLAALSLLIGASPWEGAAAVAPAGELPEDGFYIATNSFPRNTVVDIINIETNKSTRAIVANSLDSPGLLAIVSREAAELIGLRAGSIGRIRMIQPSDPIAYMRFMEGVNTGIPQFDSGAVITQENYTDIYEEDSYAPLSAIEEPLTEPVIPETLTGPGYFLEQEWRSEIVDLHPTAPIPDNRNFISEFSPIEDPAEPEETEEEPVYITENWWEDWDEWETLEEWESYEEIVEVEPYIEEDFYEEIVEEPYIYDDPVDYIAEEEYFEEIVEEPYIEEEPEEIAEEEPWYFLEPEEIAEEIIGDDIADEPEEIAEEYTEDYFDFALVPADERPPDSIYGIDLADIIPSITEPEPAPEPEPLPPPVQVVVPEHTFSVPRITELNRGAYYVQLAAIDTPESVETMINRIDNSYQPVVYNTGDSWYRILVGPLNQGESAAILARFKSIGYKDAFVRHVR